MRKTLTVLVLTISTLLLLQAPAWAPHLYRLNQIGTPTSGSPTNADYEVLTDCAGARAVTVASTSFSPQPREIELREGKFTDKNNKKWQRYTFTATVTSPDLAAAPQGLDVECNGVDMVEASAGQLPFTGVSLLRQFVLGVGLLMTGGLLVFFGTRSPSGLLTRRSPPATPRR
jgi:hypothetical protein